MPRGGWGLGVRGWGLLVLGAVFGLGQAIQAPRPGASSAPAYNVGVGAILPTRCRVGAIFFLTSSPAGTNLYGCTEVNTWTLEGAAGEGGSSRFADAETPAAGGNDTVFTLAHAPAGASLMLLWNGLTMAAGVDYILVGQTITFQFDPPAAGATLLAWYRW